MPKPFMYKAGDRVGKNTVLYPEVSGNFSGYVVECDCGNVRWVRTSILNKNKVGCWNCARLAGRKTDDSRAITSAWRTVRGNARTRGIPMEITKQQFVEAAKQNCYYCGIEPQERKISDVPEWTTPAKLNGIDRIDSSKGYTIDNIVPCCSFCNTAKLNNTTEDFLAAVSRIYNYQKENK